jgi:DNA repair exonuclease SbcCD ATPase subunit
MRNPRLPGKIILSTALLIILTGMLSSIVYSNFQGFISASRGKATAIPTEMIKDNELADHLSRTSPFWRQKLSKHIFITIDQELQSLEQHLLQHKSTEGQRLIDKVKISLQRMVSGKQKFLRTSLESSLDSFYKGRTVLEYRLWQLKNLTRNLKMDMAQSRGVHRVYALMNKWLIYVAHREISARRKGILDASSLQIGDQDTEEANTAFSQISELVKITEQDLEDAGKALSQQPTAVQETAPGIEPESLEPVTRQDSQPDLVMEEDTASPKIFEEKTKPPEAPPIPNWMFILGAMGIFIISVLLFRREEKSTHLSALHEGDPTNYLEYDDQNSDDLIEIHTLIDSHSIGDTQVDSTSEFSQEYSIFREAPPISPDHMALQKEPSSLDSDIPETTRSLIEDESPDSGMEEPATDNEMPESTPLQTMVHGFEDAAQEGMTFKLEGLTQELESTLSEKEELAQGMGSILAENESLTEKLEASQTEKENIEKQLEALHAEKEEFTHGLENILAENDSLTEKLETFHTEKEGMEAQLKTLHSREEELSQELKNTIMENDSLTEKLKAFHEEEEGLKQQTESLRVEKEEFTQGMETILTENDSLTNKLEASNKGKENLEKHLKSFHAENEVFAQGLKNTLAKSNSLTKELEASHKEKENLETQLEALHSREEELAQDLENTLAENNSLAENLETSLTEEEDWDKQLATLRTEKENFEKQLESLRAEKEELAQELKTLYSREEALARNLENTLAENSTLALQLETSHEKEEISSKLNAMTEALESTREKNESLEKEQKNIHAKSKTLTQQFKTAQEEIKGLTKDLKSTSTEKEALAKKLKAAQIKNKTITKQNKALTNQLETAQTENVQSIEPEHTLAHELEVMSADVKELKEKLEFTYLKNETLAQEKPESSNTTDLSFDHDTPELMASQAEESVMDDKTVEEMAFSILNSAKDLEIEILTGNDADKKNRNIPSGSLRSDQETSHSDVILLQTILKAAKGFRNINERLYKIAEARLAPSAKDSPEDSKENDSRKS